MDNSETDSIASRTRGNRTNATNRVTDSRRREGTTVFQSEATATRSRFIPGVNLGNNHHSHSDNSDSEPERSYLQEVLQRDFRDEREGEIVLAAATAEQRREMERIQQETTDMLTLTEAFKDLEQGSNYPRNLQSLIKEIEPSYAKPYRGEIDITEIKAYRKVLARALTKVKNHVKGARAKGYAWIVDTADEHAKRHGKETLALPKVPQLMEDDEEDMTTPLQAYEYARKKKRYDEYAHWNEQAIQALDNRFPRALDGKTTDEGEFPIDFTIREAFKYLDSRYGGDAATLKASAKIRKELNARRCDPEDLGGEAFFKAQLKDYKALRNLGVPMNKTELTYITVTALEDSDLRPKTLDSIRNDFEEAYDQPPQAADFNTVRAFYEKELHRAYQLRDKKSGRAVKALAARMDQTDARIDRNEDMLGTTLHTAYSAEQKLQELASSQQSVPPTIATTHTGTLPSVSGVSSQSEMALFTSKILSEFAAMRGEVQALQTDMAQVKQGHGQSGQTKRTPKTTTTRPWRQWKFYCYSCGVTVHHSSPDCPRKKPGHKDEATFQNQLGGNNAKNHLWMMWCHPVTSRVHKTKGGDE